LTYLNFDEILFLTDQGIVRELASSNIFFSDGDKIYTPICNEQILAGVYRKNILRFFKDRGVSIHECEIHESELARFQYAWATNCVSGIRTIRQINSIDFEVNRLSIMKDIFEVFY
jgi:branched-subunit amino acid aminotransferase/4-amino-4-deoxychorismate lyase